MVKKATGQPDGSAWVWFATRMLAERAIECLHMRVVLPDPAGRVLLPLEVYVDQQDPRSGRSSSDGFFTAATLHPSSSPRGF